MLLDAIVYSRDTLEETALVYITFDLQIHCLLAFCFETIESGLVPPDFLAAWSVRSADAALLDLGVA